MKNNNIITVTQLNVYIKSLLAGDNILKDIMVVGEISNFKAHYPSGHFYFTLKDKNASMRSVMFKGNTSKVKFTPTNGLSVIVRGSISLYEKDGGIQLYAVDMQPDGVGALNLAFEQLKEKLMQEGLFDQKFKKSIPKFPKLIGLVTSETGAALQDIINVLKRRYPAVDIVLTSVLVQGNEAAGQIARAIDYLNGNYACDVIIVGRGGGSIEELWAFNEEIVARAIFKSKIPIVSAVGHETDFTIADFVADMRAPTPSAAAELVTPDQNDILRQIDDYYSMMEHMIDQKIMGLRNKVKSAQESGGLGRLAMEIGTHKMKFRQMYQLLNINTTALLNLKKEKIKVQYATLQALSPLKVLSRGYSVVTDDDGGVISKMDDTKLGNEINIYLMDGMLKAKISEKVIREEE